MITGQYATLAEIETSWSYTDLLKTYMVLEYQNALSYIQTPEQWENIE